MPRTLKAPPELEDGKLVRYGSWEGTTVQAGDVVAVFELEGREHALVADAPAIVARQLLKLEQVITGGAPVAILADPGEDVGWETSVVQPVRVMVLRRCEECGNDYPVNGLVDSVPCTRCGDRQRASAGFWRDYLLEDVTAARVPREASGGNVLAGQHGACTRVAWGLPALCRRCSTLLPWTAINASWAEAQRGPTQIPCSGCGEPHRVRLPPAWAAEVFAGLVMLVGETASLSAAPEHAQPVVFKCPSCSAALRIDGAKRIVHCAFCDSDIYLPDDLWLHFNPAIRRGRWWMLFGGRTG